MFVNVFGPKEYHEYVHQQCACCNVKKRPNIVRVDNGWVCVYHKQHVMGVYDAQNKFVSESNLMQKNSNSHRVSRTPFMGKMLPYIDVDVVFLGDVHWHFGHFLLEHTNRLWAIKEKLPSGVKYLFIYSEVAKQVPQYVYSFMELMGVTREDIIILEQDTRFRNIYIPESVCDGKNVFKQWKSTFDVMANNAQADEVYDKIYLSRTALDKRTVFGEVAIENIFRKNGFHIVYPEKLPLAKQVALVKNAHVLAGCYGTALHLALFMKPGGRVIGIKRNSKDADNCASQYLINSVANLDSVFVWGSVETEKTQHFTSVPQIIGLNQYMREFFEKYGFEYDAQDWESNTEFQEYQESLKQYKKKFGGACRNKIKRTVIKITACLIPVRGWRGKYRSWMKHRFVG
ncbi:MAG: glycosyltransferase family 61 protein [Alphaproteobacteria bacterium]|nr:glycosyltransferase family 61 protein [Alphaproteobacteria bacterium]